MDNYPSSDMFKDFVTWAALEDSLKGIRQQIEENQNVPVQQPPPPEPQRIVIEMSSQTEPVSACVLWGQNYQSTMDILSLTGCAF